MATDIVAWLAELGLERYAEAFALNEIDAGALPHLSEDDLKDMGLALGPRRKILADRRPHRRRHRRGVTGAPPVLSPSPSPRP